MFLDKALIALISPLGTALLLGLVALFCGLQRHNRLSLAAAVGAIVWLGVWSLPPVANALLHAVESKYPPIRLADSPATLAMVVLGGGVRPPETDQGLPDLNSAADRVWHAARLYRAGKARLILLSGGSDPEISATSESKAMLSLLVDLGVPKSDILLEEESRNTRQNAEFSARILRERHIEDILLVTSALQMPRAVELFQAEGLRVFPAATDHQARTRFTATDWLPSADALEKSSRAIKEIVGRLASSEKSGQ